MSFNLSRRAVLAAATALAVTATGAFAQDKVQLRLSGVNSETDQRAIALTEVFGPAVSDFANFEPHWNGTLFGQGTELEAIASGDLEMSITSATAQNASDLLNGKRQCFVDEDHHLEGAAHVPNLIL